MEEAQKRRLEELKAKNQALVKKQAWGSNALLQECLQSLDEYALIEIEEDTEILRDFYRYFPVNEYGRLCNAVDVDSTDGLIYGDKEYYIIWDQAGVPAVRCKGGRIAACLEDVLCVSFDTFLLAEDLSEVLEFSHDGAIRKGRSLAGEMFWLLKNKGCLAERLAEERKKGNPLNTRYVREYQYPESYGLVMLEGGAEVGEPPFVPMLYKYLCGSFEGLKNGSRIAEEARSAEDWGVLLSQEMEPDSVRAEEKVDMGLLKRLFERLGIKSDVTEAVQFEDGSFYGVWWYGTGRGFSFLGRYILYP